MLNVISLISVILIVIAIVIITIKIVFDMPWSLVLWNAVAMLPILGSPIVFYVSAFAFDNPSSFIGAILMVLAMNSYPVLLIIGCICSGICWRKKKKNYAWAIPTISIVIVYGFILTMFLYEHTV